MTDDAKRILDCIISCEIGTYTALYAPDKAVVTIGNFLNLIEGLTRYKAQKAIKELKDLGLIEYVSQGCPAIVSVGEYVELVEEAHPPINGYMLTKKCFESDLWKQRYEDWCNSLKEFANCDEKTESS